VPLSQYAEQAPTVHIASLEVFPRCFAAVCPHVCLIAPTTLVGAYEWTSWVCVRVGGGPYTGRSASRHPAGLCKTQVHIRIAPWWCATGWRATNTMNCGVSGTS